MLNNEKPQERVGAQSQGQMSDANSNSTINGQLKDSRSRYDKGMSLYKEGKVKVGPNGLFKVSGYYEADTERMTCTCPDYRTRKESCKHLFAAMLFVKNRGKQTIEHLNNHGDLNSLQRVSNSTEGQGKSHGAVRNGKEIVKHVSQSTESNRLDSKVHHDGLENYPTSGKTLSEEVHGASNPSEQIHQGNSKPFDRQATITRLAVLNTAVELLKTHRTPLEPETVISVAIELEKWALGGVA